MKYIFAILLACAVLKTEAQEFTAITYNIRLDVASDGENAWTHRKGNLVDQILRFQPVILGIQEGLPHQVSYLDKRLKDYTFIGEGRRGGAEGEFAAIFYDNTKITPIKQGTFWLSDTPENVSVGWDAALPRICTYGLFKDLKTDESFWVFNTHFDHLGPTARLKSAQLILEQIQVLTKKNQAVLLMGDFNADPTSAPIEVITKVMTDSRELASEKTGPNYTFNGFNHNTTSGSCIDYIFVSKTPMAVAKHAVLDTKHEGQFISDHYPVYIQFQIQKK